jgi:hypothetical protein
MQQWEFRRAMSKIQLILSSARKGANLTVVKSPGRKFDC